MTEQLPEAPYMVTTYAPDALSSLRDSFALHLAATRAEKTTRIYLDALDKFAAHLAANGMPTSVRAIRREHVESWMAARKATVAPATQSVEYRALAVFWKWLVDEDEVDASPMLKIKSPTVPEKPVPVVDGADFKKLLKGAEGKDFVSRRDTAVMLLLFDAGLRRGELAGLKLEDVDLMSKLAYVTGKGDRTRAIRFGDRTAVAMDRYLRLRRAHRHADSEAFWLGQDGPVTGSGFAQIIAKRCAAAGLPRIHPHQFRHSFAHMYLADGGKEGDLMQLAGWSSRSMLDRYGKSLAASRARAAYRSPADRL